MSNVCNTKLSIEEHILHGDLDNSLDSIVEAIKARRAVKDRIKILHIHPGDTIRFVDSIHPKCLRGLLAKVKKVNGASCVVDIASDPAFGRFSGAKNVRYPAALVEKVS